MNPLYIGTEIMVCNISVHDHCLVFYGKGFSQKVYKPRSFPFDAIILTRTNGHISYKAIDWCIAHNVTVTFLDWKGNIIANILPSPPVENKLHIAQFQSLLDEIQHNYIANTIVKIKMLKQKQLLQSLSQYFDINVPDTKKMNEGNYARAYFAEYAKITKQFGFEFEGRNTAYPQRQNQRSGDIVNSTLNFAYAVLQAYVTKACNAIGLQLDLPYLHKMRNDQAGLVFDMQELWRANCDYAVMQTLEEIKKQHLHWKTEHYEVRLGDEIIALLIEKLKLTLSMQEILHNTRILARYITGKNGKLRFELLPVKVERSDTRLARNQILNKTAKQLGMNKSTLWYQRKRLVQNGSVRIYSKTRKHFD